MAVFVFPESLLGQVKTTACSTCMKTGTLFNRSISLHKPHLMSLVVIETSFVPDKKARIHSF
jgi:hypothetical protein